MIHPRGDWQARVEAGGLTWHGEGGGCWNEGAFYEFTEAELGRIRTTAREVYELHLLAAAHVVRHGLWSRLGVHEADVPILKASWERQDWSLMGRFDFLLDEQGQAKLIEFNAETALSVIETGPVQRKWQQEVMPGYGQFNELEKSLVAAWRRCGRQHVHCAWRPRHPETAGTLRYLAGLVREAGLRATVMAMHSLGWDAGRGSFVDCDGEPVDCCYKLYPWDWMLREPFARCLMDSQTVFVEPAWRLMLSSKGMLALLWELFSDHPALLPAYADADRLGASFVRKPFFGREGNNVCVVENGEVAEELTGECGDQQQVYQARVVNGGYTGRQAQLGVWMVGGEPVALGMRESERLIITGDSAFVPHVVR
ncbi:glutathionylspermidine synthase family protein [Prosthecobacter fusiformis]|uniref:glutathionylspermidine synthase family protein n=1 Tax=Prosthecobacter fusiformis TaxID=48464 RepID=UPI001414F066|nr:glutathionylspermidine synthase family protein [Prosthecobacter fusiformis]